MHILVVRLGAFGYILHTLPLAADLQAAGHRLAWLCEDRWSCLLEGSPLVRTIHRLPRRLLRSAPLVERVRVVRRLVAELREPGYDLVIEAQGLAKSALLARLTGAVEVLGHAPPRARELSWLLTDRTRPASAEHVIDQQRGLAALAGVPSPGPWRFPLPAWTGERAWAARWLDQAGLTGCWMLNVGAGWPTKVWPEERQAAFAKLCAAAGHRLLLVWGSPAEGAAAGRVSAAAGGVPLAPASTLPQLAGLLAQAAVLVSGDTGPLHLARALGTPAVGLFGPVPAARNGPRGASWRNLQAPGAAWERREVSRVDMGAISAEAVLVEADAIAGSRSARNPGP